jgi:hypothetical protein
MQASDYLRVQRRVACSRATPIEQNGVSGRLTQRAIHRLNVPILRCSLQNTKRVRVRFKGKNSCRREGRSYGASIIASVRADIEHDCDISITRKPAQKLPFTSLTKPLIVYAETAKNELMHNRVESEQRASREHNRVPPEGQEQKPVRDPIDKVPSLGHLTTAST